MNLQAIKFAGRGIALGFLIILAFSYYVFSQVCANTVIAEALSPDKAWKVTLFERSCGSFTGNSTHISIIKPEEALRNDAGNIYVAEGYPEGYAVDWLSDSSVRVSGVKGANHLKTEEYQGIRVLYE